MVDRNDKRFFDFMCCCKDEGMERCEKTYDDAKSSLKERFKTNISDKEFAHYIIVGLDYLDNGQAHVEGIYTDMWSGISVKYEYDYKEEIECEDDEANCRCEKDSEYDCRWTSQEFWIECDKIHHGLARAYQLVKQFDKDH